MNALDGLKVYFANSVWMQLWRVVCCSMKARLIYSDNCSVPAKVDCYFEMVCIIMDYSLYVMCVKGCFKYIN